MGAAGKVVGIRGSNRSSGSKRKSGSGAVIVYCPIYCRTGKCERRGKGCPYKHDSTKRAVCPRWLHGTCPLGTSCPLQHQRKPELMPICMHFLKGCCTAEPCPYVHVNLPAGAPVCTRFLRGYCPAGTACPHKHYTLRMVRDEKRVEATAGAAAAGGGAARHGGGKRKERRGGSGRYFDAPLPGGSPSAAGTGKQQAEEGMQDAGEQGSEEDGAGEPERKRRRQGSEEAAEAPRRASDALKPAFLLADFVPL
ncbi:hypothetical protein COHA_003548 [Chlorella ohadii]|uniref:C3H1-type domain-containing protein n=1 Tax=Chlorella ohadii TaxID=2649997 RepID=A0AAD5DSB2_9CHLO|nr:hypothetical protein COHA_003548 [Chlorella ohadii]